MLELDLGLTRDGVPVVHHDRALDSDRTRDAGGAWLTPPGAFLNALDLAALSEFVDRSTAVTDRKRAQHVSTPSTPIASLSHSYSAPIECSLFTPPCGSMISGAGR